MLRNFLIGCGIGLVGSNGAAYLVLINDNDLKYDGSIQICLVVFGLVMLISGFSMKRKIAP